MATVYLAQDLRHDRKVALKVLRPELAAVIGAERFLAEIKTTANLQHPHILPLFDSGAAEGFLFYVMPFVEGESLRDRLNREKQLPVADAVRIASEVASALDYAHRHGVIHRDIKPENVLLHDGRALVADFGIALAASKAGGTRMTETGMSLGTPHYMSPEQAMGEREITARSDVYALGAMTYEMLVGEPPFTGPTAQSIVAKVLTEVPRPLLPKRHTIPPHVEAAVLAALEKLPADRFASAAEFEQALNRPDFSPRTTAVRPSVSPGRRPWIPIAAAAVLVLGIGAIAGFMLRRPPAVSAPFGRFAIQLEPVTSLGSGFAQQVALSADGSMLAFVGRGARGNQIYLRAMGDSLPRAITGSEGGFGPFFSPDGRQIAFWTPQRLQRVPVDGGTPTLIADSAARWAAWTDQGAVVYATEDSRGLRIIEADGKRGEVVRIDSGSFSAMSALPGGRAVLVGLITGGRVRTSIAAVTLKDGVLHDVGLPDVIFARYVPSGHVIYQRRSGGPLLAAPFDLGALAVRGDGHAVGPEARITFRVIPQWDAAGTSIVYIPPAPARLVLVDRFGRGTTLEDEPRSYHHPRFSPDGRLIALDITEPDSRDIWIVDVSDHRMTRLTVDQTANDPYWSPDGRRLAYTTPRSGLRAVFAINSDGSGVPDSVFANRYDFSSGSWSSDGRTLVLSSSLTAGLWVVPLDGSRKGEVIPGSRPSEAYPALSPDGRWLAYISDESGRQEVYVRPFPGPGGRIQVSVNGGTEAVWNRNGREMFYREESGPVSRLVSAQVNTASGFQVLSRTPLMDMTNYVTAEDHSNFDVSPDGNHFVFIQSPQASQINLIQNWATQLNPNGAHD